MQREKKKKRYGMAENIHYIYRFLFRRYPRTKLLLAGLVLLVTVTPLISNVTVAAAVASVTDNRGVHIEIRGQVIGVISPPVLRVVGSKPRCRLCSKCLHFY